MSQDEAACRLQEVSGLISDAGAAIAGPIATSAHAVAEDGRVDFELLVPVNKPVSLGSGYGFMESFRLENCIRVRQVGDPSLLQGKIAEMGEYIAGNGLVPRSDGYTVMVGEAPDSGRADGMISEFYVSVDR